MMAQSSLGTVFMDLDELEANEVWLEQAVAAFGAAYTQAEATKAVDLANSAREERDRATALLEQRRNGGRKHRTNGQKGLVH
jgi:hypothetical protein